RPTGPGARPQRGCRVPHPKRCDGGGRLLYCGAWVSASRPRAGTGPVARHRRAGHRGSGDLPVTQPQRRFTGVRPSRLSLARVHLDGFRLPLGFTRLLSHASLPGACAGREPSGTLIGAVGAQPTATLQKRLARRTALYGFVAAFRAEGRLPSLAITLHYLCTTMRLAVNRLPLGASTARAPPAPG